MTDIVFVNLPVSDKELYGSFAASASHEPPLGLCFLAAAARSRGYQTKILDAKAESLDLAAAVGRVLQESPRFVGISAVTLTISQARRFATLLKKNSPKVKIIIGGAHITALPKESLEYSPAFDLGVVGEGEATIVELLDALRDGRSLEGVRGIVYRQNSSIVVSPARELIADLDTLPLPAWDLLPDLTRHYFPPSPSLKRLPSFSIITSRGCPYNCIFCDKSAFGSKIRSHQPAYILSMIKDLYYNYGVRDLRINDDNFVLLRNNVSEVCRRIKQEGLDLSWCCLSSVQVINPEIVRTLKEAGCWQLRFGLESGSQRILDIIQKCASVEKARQAIEITRRAGIESYGFFMIANPGETKETIRQTIDFAKSLPLDVFKLNFLTPLPGSKLWDNAEEFGSFDRTWEKLSFHIEPVFIPRGLAKEELVYYKKAAYREFYLRPKVIWRYLKKMRSRAQALGLLRGAASLLNFWRKD
jgi:radical SAM superfamily enzyme YgiQ (UPF0313 family)